MLQLLCKPEETLSERNCSSSKRQQYDSNHVHLG